MSIPLLYTLAAIIGYLLGSIPVGYLVGRSHGIDIREHGSGNIGATNVVRVLGKKPGYFVFACDAFKGWLSAWLGRWMIYTYAWRLDSFSVTSGITPTHPTQGTDGILLAITTGGIVAALACILGHNFPVWLKFRGGKGVATTVGVLLGLMPLALGISAVIWVACFYLFRYVSLASLLGAAALPVTVGLLTTRAGGLELNNPLFWFSLAAATLIFWRHRANIVRLLNGTESRFGRKPAPASSTDEPQNG